MQEPESRSITNAQSGLHENLVSVVKKHLLTHYQKPISAHTQEAFDSVKSQVDDSIKAEMPLILDSCCGTAMSTRIIAQNNPDALVIGIDRSASRLGKEYNNDLPANALLVQAECADFWLLAKEAGWKLHSHSILYPNPYPKTKHLKRRWHGHPAFPILLSLGGKLELRTNWKVYAEEFCEAVRIAKADKQGCQGVECIQAEVPLTLFEKKYQKSGQELYRVKISL